jgi:hypothetical protein
MALFKRDKRETPPAADVESTPDADAAASATDAASAVEAGPAAAPAPDAEPVPQVNISVTTFGKPAPAAAPAAPATGAPAEGSGAAPHPSQPTKPRPPAEAPTPAEVIPGLPDNAALRQALQDLPDQPDNSRLLDIMRQCLQGTLYLRVRGDARALMAEKKELTLAVSAIGENRFLLAFSGGQGLQDSIRSDGDTATSAIGQPARHVLANATGGPYAGIILDHATEGARVILPIELVKKALDEADPTFAVKTLLAAPRTDETAGKVAEALTTAKLWVAANQTEAGLGLAESRTASGTRRIEIYSHPLEVLVMGRGDRPLPITGTQLGKALASDPALTGVVVDPAGPWIELDRDVLAPVIALADEGDAATPAP